MKALSKLKKRGRTNTSKLKTCIDLLCDTLILLSALQVLPYLEDKPSRICLYIALSMIIGIDVYNGIHVFILNTKYEEDEKF